MRILIALFFLFISGNVRGQMDSEFEGIIRYEHKFQFTATDVDTTEIKNAYGTSSIFYYKNGNYKWVINSIPFQIEYFDSKTQTVFFLYKDNDTLFRSKERGWDDTLLMFREINEFDSVCNHWCSIVETISFNREAGFQIKRTLSYSGAISLDSNRFYNYRTYGSNIIFRKIKSWPLKIRLEITEAPFIYTIEAVEVIPTKLKDFEIEIPADRVIKNLFN